MRHERFTFVCTRDERRILASLSERLARTQSDTVRWLILSAARELRMEQVDHMPAQEVLRRSK